MSKFTGLLLVTIAIALLAHSGYLVSKNPTEMKPVESAIDSVSVAISQFFLASPSSQTEAAEAAAAQLSGRKSTKQETGGGSGTGKMKRMLLFVEVITAVALAIIGISQVTGSALRSAQRVEVNGTAPYASFDSCVYSGQDFAHSNHRGRTLGRNIGVHKH